MFCIKIEGPSLSKEAGEIVTFENLKASFCYLDPPENQSGDKITQQPASPHQEKKIANRN